MEKPKITASRLALPIMILSLSGCASIMKDSEQRMTIKESPGMTEQTICIAENDKGVYGLTPGIEGKVRRSKMPLKVECISPGYYGKSEVKTNRVVGFKILNFFLVDFCTLSCLLDRQTGKGFNYYPIQEVEMNRTNQPEYKP